MSPRARVIAIVAVAALLAAGGTVGLAVLTANDSGGESRAQHRPGAPPLVLDDLGVRDDPEARALRRAERLYADGRRAAAGRIFARYDSLEAQVGATLAAWPDNSLNRLERRAEQRPQSSLVLYHLGWARVWAGRNGEAIAAWQRAVRAEPDTASAELANDELHPDFPAGQPQFVPSFAPPARLARLSSPRQFAELERAARRPDVHGKLLYGLALQRLGRRISAQRAYDEAAKLAPEDPEAQVAAAVVRFDKRRPATAFSRLGPLTRRFPRAPTVRFHLGLLLLWLSKAQPGACQEGKRQLRLARDQARRSTLALEANRYLARLEDVC